MPVNYKQNRSLPLLVSTRSTASDGYKTSWQAANSAEYQHFPSQRAKTVQTNRRQLNPAASQQAITYYNFLVNSHGSFLGDRADTETWPFPTLPVFWAEYCLLMVD